MIHRLAHGDILRMEAVTKLKLTEALAFIAYETDVALQDKVNIHGNSH